MFWSGSTIVALSDPLLSLVFSATDNYEVAVILLSAGFDVK